MKKILGLDLGTTSIGWAYIHEGDENEHSTIHQIGVRVNPLTTDEQTNFEKGKPLTTNADRTLKRGARRNLDRYQLRRKKLLDICTKAGIIHSETKLTEDGKDTTHQTWELRAKAVTERIELVELVRILLAINKKRGYKSSRKVKSEDDGQAIDGMEVAKLLYERQLTPGEWVYQNFEAGEKKIPSFYQSDLQNEFDRIWQFQKQFYPEMLNDEFYKDLKGQGQRATSAIFWKTYQFNIADIKDYSDSFKNKFAAKFDKRTLKKIQAYQWRSEALKQQLEKEHLAYVLTDINSDLKNSSGYLGAISDRSKELYFNKETVGQYLFKRINENRHLSLKNQVFYRQDYIDEFERIWNKQAEFHPQLTEELKVEIRDKAIFYQRRLKSQKGLISFCEFESKEIPIGDKKKTVGARVAPKSSPLFQEFKIWQNLNNLTIKPVRARKRKSKNEQQTELFGEKENEWVLDLETKEILFEELNLKGNLSASAIFNILGYSPKEFETNYKQLEGNRTKQALYHAYLKIVELEGYDVRELLKIKSDKDELVLSDLNVSAKEIKSLVRKIFESLSINTRILDFKAELDGKEFEQQASYQLWHLLHSAEDDAKRYPLEEEQLYGKENIGLKKQLCSKFGFKPEHAKVLAQVVFQDDYGNLSTKAMRRIYPHIKENMFSVACELAGYRHSKMSLTKEELEKRELQNKLDLLPKNSLRNPVVEKILNQMVNVVNMLIDKENDKLEALGKPRDFHFDEIRIELARELKKSAKEREEMTKGINEAKNQHDKLAKRLQEGFGIANPTRNDIIKLKLYDELQGNNYHDLYTNKYISRDLLFSKQIDIEHIIPQARLFDDSFSNKTIVYREENIKKSSRTAYDYISEDYGDEKLEQFVSRVEDLYKSKVISKAKYQKLLKKESEIGEGFIDRDLRDSQYIAKKAKEILFSITPSVVTTTGQITARLRDDWGLINVMKELNLPKYRELGYTEMEERKYGQEVEQIIDWTKRNDHRHHAMDALTIAFTKRSFIQYLNNLNARGEGLSPNRISNTDRTSIGVSDLRISSSDVWGIEQKELHRDGNGKLRFNAPLAQFRQIAKEHLKKVIISHKAKNKVVTPSRNRIAGKNKPQITLTPRGQLHKETVYGKYHFYSQKEEKISSKFDRETILKVSHPLYRKLLLERLETNGNDPQKAFSGKNALSKNPIYLNIEKTKELPDTVKLIWLEEDFSIRKDVNPDNFKEKKNIEKVVDKGIREILLNRLDEYDGDAQKAFADLDNNPIWLNKAKGIAIKRVTISGVKNAEALHSKRNHFGELLYDEKGKEIPTDYVSTGNNHHVAVYRDAEGKLQEQVVSFFEAVARINQKLPLIDKEYKKEEGWQFLFTMKQNELFVFPNEKTGFRPNEIDLLDPANKELISPNLFRVQKISTKNYFFRHHLETTVETPKALVDVTYKPQLGLNGIIGIAKVRTNHLGDIISVGEY